jgi:hypothetical protein
MAFGSPSNRCDLDYDVNVAFDGVQIRAERGPVRLFIEIGYGESTMR